jgi:uncharacterized membrane protein YeaQ/YmgE (transglycosylase-associated protein family)
MEALIVQLVSGAIGGNVAGNLLKTFDMGVLRNSIAGIIGGGIGGSILSNLGIGGLDGIVGQIAGGGIGGVLLMAVGGALKNMLGRDDG